MVPARRGVYRFDPDSLTEVRRRLGLSQGDMAKRLGVPQNTLSRWETGATTPDAESLAAVYSAGTQGGFMATFFAKQASAKQTATRNRALCYWDMATIPASPLEVERAAEFIRQAIAQRVPRAKTTLLKAFSRPQDSQATSILEARGWRVWQDAGDWDEEIFDQALSDSGQAPHETVVFLITTDAGFADLVEDLRQRGVRVYLIAPPQVAPSFVNLIGSRRHIPMPTGMGWLIR